MLMLLSATVHNLWFRAVHWRRTGIGSTPAEGPIVDKFFSDTLTHQNNSTLSEVKCHKVIIDIFGV